MTEYDFNEVVDKYIKMYARYEQDSLKSFITQHFLEYGWGSGDGNKRRRFEARLSFFIDGWNGAYFNMDGKKGKRK